MSLLTAFIQGCMVTVTVYVGYRLVRDVVDYYREKRDQRIRARYNHYKDIPNWFDERRKP